MNSPRDLIWRNSFGPAVVAASDFKVWLNNQIEEYAEWQDLIKIWSSPEQEQEWWQEYRDTHDEWGNVPELISVVREDFLLLVSNSHPIRVLELARRLLYGRVDGIGCYCCGAASLAGILDQPECEPTASPAYLFSRRQEEQNQFAAENYEPGRLMLSWLIDWLLVQGVEKLYADVERLERLFWSSR